MPEITIQPIYHDRLAQIHALILEEDPVFLTSSMGFVPVLEEIQRQTVNDPDFDPELLLGAFIQDELAGSIMGIRRPWKESQKHTGFIKWIIVKKKYRRQNIGRMLIEECEKLLEIKGAKTLQYGGSAPLYLFPGVPRESDGLISLLESRGWNKQSDRVSLFTYLDETTITEELFYVFLNENRFVHIAIATPEDEKETSGFITHEFTPSWAKEACAAIHNPKEAFCSILREAESNTVIGFAAVNGTNPYWFGPMGVRPDLRKKGLGRLLVYHTFLTAQNRGMPHLMIPWINGKETFYNRFVTRMRWQVYYKFEKTIRYIYC